MRFLQTAAKWGVRPKRELMRSVHTGVRTRVYEIKSDVPDGIRGMVLEDFTVPDVQPGQLLLKVNACAVMFPDLLRVAGRYQRQPLLPYTPGGSIGEVVGEVIDVGDVSDSDSTFRIGDRVLTKLDDAVGGGGFATHCVAETAATRLCPAGFSDEQAAGFSYAYGTAYYGLVQKAQVKRGEHVLIMGAGGTVGLAAVQIAKILGATVIATAGTEEKLSVLRIQGADHCINHSKVPEFRDTVKQLTGGKGVDVVYDPLGGAAFLEALRSCDYDARVLVLGFASQPVAVAPTLMPTHVALIKALHIMGAPMHGDTTRHPELAKPREDQIFEWADDGLLAPHVSHIYPLEAIQDAFFCLHNRHVIGKCVVKP